MRIFRASLMTEELTHGWGRVGGTTELCIRRGGSEKQNTTSVINEESNQYIFIHKAGTEMKVIIQRKQQ
ncbi:hypothetical protein NDU88_006388 [Pleurodeles waltl]|uniref:Uncharacterized protein n=1 Tax=Pleurodeles waltl TaxID=8319 RepID=A0AAV7PIN4_PLEWA|nr:hypothetical protein NDU88_006388 [Pleurodeles waltl]